MKVVALNTWMRTGFKFIYHRNFRKWRFSIFITWNALPRTCPTIWSPLFQLSQSIFHCSTVHSQLYTGIHDMLNQILATVLLLPLCPYSVVWWFDMCIHFQAQKPSCLMDYNIFREIRDEDSSVHCSKSFSLSLSIRIHYFQQKYKDKQLQLLCIRADIMWCGQSTPLFDVSIADWHIDAYRMR